MLTRVHKRCIIQGQKIHSINIYRVLIFSNFLEANHIVIGVISVHSGFKTCISSSLIFIIIHLMKILEDSSY